MTSDAQKRAIKKWKANTDLKKVEVWLPEGMVSDLVDAAATREISRSALVRESVQAMLGTAPELPDSARLANIEDMLAQLLSRTPDTESIPTATQGIDTSIQASTSGERKPEFQDKPRAPDHEAQAIPTSTQGKTQPKPKKPRKSATPDPALVDLVLEMRGVGQLWDDVADALNSRGISTVTGKQWTAANLQAYCRSTGIV